MRARTSTAAICAALTVLSLCPIAGAQVVVEPESPAGQEYSLPFERARQQGAGNEEFNASPSAREPTPVFGEGISRPGAADEAGPSPSAAGTADGTAAAGLPELDDGGGDGTLVVVAVVAGVVLLAGLAFATGAAARRAP
ncbi:MAG: hypothetical protein ACRDL6_10295 [Solirubrobacterales bacterium]